MVREGHGGTRRVSIAKEIWWLSWRAGRRLVRSPILLQAHWIAATVAAIAIAVLWAGSGAIKDIKGLHNRLGVTFFCTCYFAFSSLSGLTVFLERRGLFLRERGASL